MPGPVPNDPIVDFPHQSVIVDTVLIERTSNKLGNYDPVEPGAPYPKETHTAAQVGLFDGNEFLGQKATSDEQWMQRFFGSVPTAKDVANWDESFAEDSNPHPTFQRRYLEKRDTYAPRTKLTALPGLYRIQVTAPGSGYKVPPTVSFSSPGAVAVAIINNAGQVTKITVKVEGTYTSVPTVSITAAAGDPGTGATATAIIQPDTCLLIKEQASDNAPDPYRSLYLLVTRIYDTLPGPILVEKQRSESVRNVEVDIYAQKAATGTLPSESGTLVISSKVSPVSSVVEQRVSEKIAELPPDEVWYDYQYADIPRRIFALNIEVVCNLTDQYALLVRPVTKPAGSFMRKHRTTISYSATPPGDTALNIITRADLDYEGKAINHHYHGVLNDAIVFSGIATVGGCTWTEAYNFPASNPSATSFGGKWWLISRQTTPWGTTGWRTKTVEYFEP